MTVIYLDTLFLLNFSIDYLLLLASAKIAGERLARGRFLLAAAVGGIYAGAIFIPACSFLNALPCRIAVGGIMLVIAFGKTKRLFRQTVLFLALCCAFAGSVLGITFFGGRGLSLGNGVFYSESDLKIVLLATAGCYCILSLVFRQWGKHTYTSGQLKKITISFFACTQEVTALVDTGNTLKDPISGRPVIIASACVLKHFPPLALHIKETDLQNPAQLALTLQNTPLAGRIRLLPYHTVGVTQALLLGLRSDYIICDDATFQNIFIAFSPTDFNGTNGYTAITGTDSFH